MVAKAKDSEPSRVSAISRPVRRRYQDVVEEVLKAVAVGSISAGDRLSNERELAKRCGVSRSSAREALLALELSGVVEVRPGSGCFLTGMGLHADALVSSAVDSLPRELLEVRQLIEPQVAQLCALRARKEDLKRLERLVADADRKRSDSSPEGLERFVGLSLDFHRELARSCGNATLTSLMSHLVNAAEHPLWLLIDGIVVRDPVTRSKQVEEHRIILNAIIQGRGEVSAEAMTTHLGALSTRIFGKNLSPPKVVRTRRTTR